jgi:dTDP-4-dehydrorhamnose 3,5-epimerase
LESKGQQRLIDIASERAPSVNPEGKPLASLIEDVKVRPAKTQTDARGTLAEVYDPRWGFSDEPMVYAYAVTIRPGVTKGWIVHQSHDDRLFFAVGSLRAVLYDDREGSPTRGKLNELFFDVHNRGLLQIPKGVWHAITNVGLTDALMFNLPTEPYHHDSPDKWDLPLDTPEIPYEF